ncbi:MAG: polymer-forming cytoskeletal protein [Chloroflexota bacterium]
MFSRRPDRPKDETRSFATPATRATDPLAPIPTPPSPGAWPPPGGLIEPGAPPPQPRVDATVVAEGDSLEGTLVSGQGVLVAGRFAGRIESERWIRLAEGSVVHADVTADEIVVAGQYEGRLVARSRLEIAATGHLRGEIEAPRLQLHEGGVIDGALYMTGREAREAARRAAAGPPSAADVTPRSASVRASSGGGAPAASPRRPSPAGDPSAPPASSVPSASSAPSGPSSSPAQPAPASDPEPAAREVGAPS